MRKSLGNGNRCCPNCDAHCPHRLLLLFSLGIFFQVLVRELARAHPGTAERETMQKRRALLWRKWQISQQQQRRKQLGVSCPAGTVGCTDSCKLSVSLATVQANTASPSTPRNPCVPAAGTEKEPSRACVWNEYASRARLSRLCRQSQTCEVMGLPRQNRVPLDAHKPRGCIPTAGPGHRHRECSTGTVMPAESWPTSRSTSRHIGLCRGRHRVAAGWALAWTMPRQTTAPAYRSIARLCCHAWCQRMFRVDSEPYRLQLAARVKVCVSPTDGAGSNVPQSVVTACRPH